MKISIMLIAVICFAGAQMSWPVDSDAFLYHATKKAARKRIMKKGFDRAHMNKSSRFGKGVYTAERRQTAKAEVPKAKEVIRLKESKYLKKNTVDLTRPTPKKIRTVVKEKDLRGDVKKGVIGPKLGKKIGRTAGRNGQVVRYKSATGNGGNNIVVPAKVYADHPRIVRPDRVTKIRKVKGMTQQ